MHAQIWETQNRREKITININRTLKLTNVLIREIALSELAFENEIYTMMQDYIQSRGITPVGPVITYSRSENDEAGYTRACRRVMIQLSQEIESDDSYEFSEQIRVERCLYARFCERIDNLPYAYDKLGVYAFENDLRLSGESYTISLNSYCKKLTADIFMPFEWRHQSHQTGHIGRRIGTPAGEEIGKQVGGRVGERR